MKKLLCMMMALALLCGAAIAEIAYVTISDGEGALVLAHTAVEFSDVDEDGALTVYDLLHAAHEAYYEGGAEAGFAAGDQGYGLSLTRLWGVENGGSYGYYVNDVSAMSLTDPVAEGDHVHAYVYTDTTAWSDVYCYFDAGEVSAAAGETVKLTLTAATFDADWNPVAAPVANAIITVDGEDSAFVTGEDGSVELSLDAAGAHVISARSDEMVLVPPVCILTVAEAE